MNKLFGIIAILIGIFLLVASVISFGHLMENAWMRGGMLAAFLFSLLLLLGGAAFLLTGVLLMRMRSHYLPRLYELDELDELDEQSEDSPEAGERPEGDGPRLE